MLLDTHCDTLHCVSCDHVFGCKGSQGGMFIDVWMSRCPEETIDCSQEAMTGMCGEVIAVGVVMVTVHGRFAFVLFSTFFSFYHFFDHLHLCLFTHKSEEENQ